MAPKSEVSCIPVATSVPAAPPALADDPYYVANSEYQKTLNEVEDQILAYCADIEPVIVQIARLKFSGTSNGEIARTLKRRKKFVTDTVASVQCKTLVGYLQHRQLAEDGISQIHIKDKLWRLAVDLEKVDPQNSIKALAELNKMLMPSNNPTSNQPVQIVINNQMLPRGALDG